MNTSERFFRRYIFSTVRIIVLFLAVNALLVASYFVIAYLGNVATSKFPIEDFSNHIMATDGEFSADTQAKEMLNNFEAWAMILDDDGTVVWEENLPEELPRHYSTMDIAMFSRWYLDDYPTNIAKRQDGLLVIGLPPESVVNYYFSFKAQYIWPMLFGLTAVFCINIFFDDIFVYPQCPPGRKSYGADFERHSASVSWKACPSGRNRRVSRNQCWFE